MNNNTLKMTLGVSVASLILGAAPVHSQEKHTLKVADTYPVGHPFAEYGILVFISEAEKMSNGRITFEHFPSGQMGGASTLPNMTRNGVIDISSVAPAYIPDQLPMSGVADLPGLADNSCVASKALINDMLQPGDTLYEADFKRLELRPLIAGVIPGYEVMTTSKAITKPADLTGLSVRSSGGSIDRTVRLLGGSGVAMPAAEMYESLLRGTVDGTVLGPVSASPYKLEEVITHSTLGARLGSFTMTYSIGDRSFNSLPEDLQTILVEAGRKATDSLCEALDRENAASIDEMKLAGVDFFNIDNAGREDWANAISPVQEMWVEDMESIGRPGKQALEEYKSAIATIPE
tara:strand:+ start:576 stop:1619 length:1044 start_codon:yes stop_codon:yes gene_type:complete